MLSFDCAIATVGTKALAGEPWVRRGCKGASVFLGTEQNPFCILESKK